MKPVHFIDYCSIERRPIGVTERLLSNAVIESCWQLLLFDIFTHLTYTVTAVQCAVGMIVSCTAWLQPISRTNVDISMCVCVCACVRASRRSFSPHNSIVNSIRHRNVDIGYQNTDWSYSPTAVRYACITYIVSNTESVVRGSSAVSIGVARIKNWRWPKWRGEVNDQLNISGFIYMVLKSRDYV